MSKNNKTSAATQDDVDRGVAIFWIPDSRSKAYDVGRPLPADAWVVADIEVGEGERIPAGTRVTVIQAEIIDDTEVLLGFRYEKGAGVCDLGQLRFAVEK